MMLQDVCSNIGVGHDKTEHGCHVRHNHACTFGNTKELHIAAGYGTDTLSSFRDCISSHDGPGHMVIIIRGEIANQAINCVCNFFNRQLFSNHAGGSYLHQIFINIQGSSNQAGTG